MQRTEIQNNHQHLLPLFKKNYNFPAGRFDEDGSFIGQYGTLQRQIREQQQQLQQREQQLQQQVQQRQQPQQPQFWRENSNSQRISSGAMPPHHAYFPSKSAAGGTYV